MDKTVKMDKNGQNRWPKLEKIEGIGSEKENKFLEVWDDTRP